MILKQKISDKLTIRNIKINMSITVKITKIKNKINTKIADDLSSYNGNITAEIKRILNTKITNKHLHIFLKLILFLLQSLAKSITNLMLNSIEIKKINLCDAEYASKA